MYNAYLLLANEQVILSVYVAIHLAN